MSILTILSAVSSFFQATWSTTWKRRLIIASGFAAAAAAGYSLGRFTTPARIETREVEKVVTKVETKIEWREKVVIQKAKAETRIIYVDRVVEKDGTIKEKIKTEIVATENTTANKDKEGNKNEKLEQEKEKIVTKVVTNHSNWRVGVDVGWSWPEPKVTIYGPLIIGVRVERRIVAGLNVGVWVNTSVAAGAGLSYSF